MVLQYPEVRAADELQKDLIEERVFHMNGCRLRSTGFERASEDGGVLQAIYLICPETRQAPPE